MKFLKQAGYLYLLSLPFFSVIVTTIKNLPFNNTLTTTNQQTQQIKHHDRKQRARNILPDINNSDDQTNQIISAYISATLQKCELIISNLQFNHNERDETYWTTITDTIEQTIINQLTQKNTFLHNDKIIIFNPELFFISKNVNDKSYDPKTNQFTIEGFFLNSEIKTFFKLKMENFDDHDILQYFINKIAPNRTINFEVDDFEPGNLKFWTQQIINKIYRRYSKIYLNNQLIEVDGEKFQINWINWANRKNNKTMTLGLRYRNKTTAIKVGVKYDLKNSAIKITLMKSLLNQYIATNTDNFSKLHPFNIGEDKKILADLFDYISNRLTYHDLPLELNFERLQLKTLDGNTWARPMLSQENIAVFYDDTLLGHIVLSFDNYDEKFNFESIKQIIANNCVVDISKISMNLNLEEQEKLSVEIFEQIKDSKLLINLNYYRIGDIFSASNFKVRTFNIINSIYGGQKNLKLEIDFFYNKQFYNKFQVSVQIKKITIHEIANVWNDLFQDAFVESYVNNFLLCEKLSVCMINWDKTKLISSADQIVIWNQWNSIIGQRLTFLTDLNHYIDNDYFEIDHVEADFYDIENNDPHYILNQYGAKIKQYMHWHQYQINGIKLTLKLKTDKYQYFPQTMQDIRFNFILPVAPQDI